MPLHIAIRTCLAASAAAFLSLLCAAAAHAAVVTVNYTGTVSTVTGDLNGPIASSDTISGTLSYESTTAGAYTPSPNPTFVRAEMLYTGAVTSANVTVNGDTASGTGGDVQIFDALDPFAGEDSWEATTSIASGAIGGVAMTSIFVNPAFFDTAFTLADGDPIPAPLDQAQSSFNQFSILSASGGTAYGSIDTYEVIGGGDPPPVPVLHGVGALLLAGAFGVAGWRTLRAV